MSEEELIETLKSFEEKRVEQLPENAKKLFYAIMKIADERDFYKNIVYKAREYIKEHIRIDDEYIGYMEMLLEDYKELLEILGSDKK